MKDDYIKWLSGLKEKIRNSQIKAALKVNEQLLRLYWELGLAITEKQKQTEWGDKILDQLAKDLLKEFPEIRGFSRSNLFNIRKWFLYYSSHIQLIQQPVRLIGEGNIEGLIQEPVGQFPNMLGIIPWGHHIQIITKCHSIEEAVFYLQYTAQHYWSRNVLIHQIESQLFQRKGQALTNFQKTLPQPQSDLAKELLKNPYNFEFLSLGPEANERDLENGLINQMKKFLLELGSGFAFINQQHHLIVGDKDYFLDLLFYHTRLHCYIVIELKVGEFEVEYTSKLDFYLTAIDNQQKAEIDNPSIGLLLCKKANKVIAEYSLLNASKAMGISEYKILHETYKDELPSIEALQQELKEVELPKKPIEEKLTRLKQMIGQIKGEEFKQEKTTSDIIKLFDQTLPELQLRIEKILAEVIKLFKSNFISRVINEDNNFLTHIDLQPRITTDTKVYNLGLHIELRGLIKAGINTFNVLKDLKFELYQTYYRVKVYHRAEIILKEKLYHQHWTDQELDELAEKFSEIIIDDIKESVEQIH